MSHVFESINCLLDPFPSCPTRNDLSSVAVRSGRAQESSLAFPGVACLITYPDLAVTTVLGMGTLNVQFVTAPSASESGVARICSSTTTPMVFEHPFVGALNQVPLGFGWMASLLGAAQGTVGPPMII